MTASRAVADNFLGHLGELGVRHLFGATGGGLIDTGGQMC
jgi:hypothetical protein